MNQQSTSKILNCEDQPGTSAMTFATSENNSGINNYKSEMIKWENKINELEVEEGEDDEMEDFDLAEAERQAQKCDEKRGGVNKSSFEQIENFISKLEQNGILNESEIRKSFKYEPQLDAFLRYGDRLTSKRHLYMDKEKNIQIYDIPENFLEELLLHLANANSKNVLKMAYLNLANVPIPTILKPLLNQKKEYQIGNRILFESIELPAANGQILHVFDGELKEKNNEAHCLRMILVNKMDWFEISMIIQYSTYIRRLEFTKWNIEPLDDFVKNFFHSDHTEPIKQNGNSLEAIYDILWSNKLDLFIRRGASFTQFQHFKTKREYNLFDIPVDYIGFLISYISNTKHPEAFINFEINFELDDHKDIESFNSIDEIWEICREMHKKDIEFDNEKLHIFSAFTLNLQKDEMQVMQFTLANLPTNYVFDVEVQFGKGLSIIGIKIQRRKNEEWQSKNEKVGELKRCIQQLGKIGDPTEANLADIDKILKKIGDIVCDMDLAQVFCALDGLQLIKMFLAKKFDPSNSLFTHLLSVLAQHNPKQKDLQKDPPQLKDDSFLLSVLAQYNPIVRQLMLENDFLAQCLDTMADEQKSPDYRLESVGAVSAMVKGYLPALIQFIQLDGPEKLMKCFESGLQTDEKKLVHRCAVAAVALRNNFSVEVLNTDSDSRKVSQLPDKMRAKIEERNHDENYNETNKLLKIASSTQINMDSVFRKVSQWPDKMRSKKDENYKEKLKSLEDLD